MTEIKNRPRLLVDIVTDPVCPWCYVGLRAFQHARDKLRDRFQVLPRIRAYELNPGTPTEGADRMAHYSKKFPDPKTVDAMVHQLKAAAAGAGFSFDPLKPKHLPNTQKAHRLIRYAHFDGAQERMADQLYLAYWEDCSDIGNTDILVSLAEKAGLDGDSARQEIESEKNAAEIKAECDAFRAAGVASVPTFIVNERTGFSGALPPARLAEALEQAASQTPGVAVG